MIYDVRLFTKEPTKFSIRRVTVGCCADDGKLFENGEYHVFLSEDYVEDKLHIMREPTQREFEEAAKAFVGERIPTLEKLRALKGRENAVLLMNDGTKYGTLEEILGELSKLYDKRQSDLRN